MAKTPDNTSAFSLLALAMAILLLAAAVVLYLQSGTGAEGESPTHELAALSQAVPLHAANDDAGDDRAFGRLETALSGLTELKAGVSELPGDAPQWTNLEQHARAILANRSDIEQILEATSYVDEHMPQMLEASDGLLDVTGATAIVQEFQARAQNLHQSLGQLLLVSDSRT